ncbi:PAS domain S-box protein [Desulfosporosinus hippei]|uniref:histidine kinase n=1 Tax=Desulfosporosinus hippei DSM 8344 TaxID=1121419 RepID=A0A1G8FZJ0_9FIRM|nr:PAS domain S-box protein [Desulfosporosinus hippei]SDH87396.1 PAS domain S-box-containing protein [Desulfosporosinus hippei DSM 8344]
MTRAIEHNTLNQSHITDKTQTQKELKDRNERLELVLEATGAGVWDYDLVNNRNYIDKRCKAILGYEENEITDELEEWRSRWYIEDSEKIAEAIRLCEEGKTDQFDLEYRLQHKNGSYLWVRSIGRFIYNEQCEPIRAVGTISDITKYKEAEDRIIENENKFKDFARAIPDVSAIVDEDGRYIEVFGNKKHTLMPNLEMVGRTFHELFPAELADLMLEDIRLVIETGENRSMIREMDIGSVKRYFEGRTAPMQYQVNGKKTAVVVVSDITERYEVERMLKFTYELQRKSDFINDILSGNISLTEKTLEMAEKLKINFRGSLCCFLINVLGHSDKDQKDQRINDHSKQMVNRLIYLISNNTNYLVWNNCDKIGVLCESNLINDSNTPKDLTQSSIMTASELKAFLSNAEHGLTISIGISDFHSGIDCIKNSYKEAWNTLISAQCQIHKDGGVFHYKDVGLFQILSLIYEQDYSSEFVRKMIGCIIDYDKEKGSDLLITLEEILQSNNLKDAANRLYIHYKTLVFRKRRIEEILGVSLESVDTRLALAAAIKLHRLINTSISLLKRTPKRGG